MLLFCSYNIVIKYNIAESTNAQHDEFNYIHLIKTGGFLNISFFSCLQM